MPDYRGSLLRSKPLYCLLSARTGVVGHNIDRCISLGLISVHCMELRGVHFLEVQNVLVLW